MSNTITQTRITNHASLQPSYSSSPIDNLDERINETFFNAIMPIKSLITPAVEEEHNNLVGRVQTGSQFHSSNPIAALKSEIDTFREMSHPEKEEKVVALPKKEKTEHGYQLDLHFLKLHEHYYTNVHLPRVLGLTQKAKDTNANIKDLTKLSSLLNDALSSKSGKFKAEGEHKDLLDRIRLQEGLALLDKNSSWDSPDSIKLQVEDLKAKIQNLAQEVNTGLMEISRERELMSHFFEPTQKSIENGNELNKNILRRIA